MNWTIEGAPWTELPDGTIIRATQSVSKVSGLRCVSFVVGKKDGPLAHIHLHVGGDDKEFVRLRSFKLLDKGEKIIAQFPESECHAS